MRSATGVAWRMLNSSGCPLTGDALIRARRNFTYGQARGIYRHVETSAVQPRGRHHQSTADAASTDWLRYLRPPLPPGLRGHAATARGAARDENDVERLAVDGGAPVQRGTGCRCTGHGSTSASGGIQQRSCGTAHVAGDDACGTRAREASSRHFGRPRGACGELVYGGARNGDRICRDRAGDEVILPSFTFVSTANAVLNGGARAVFADIDPRRSASTRRTSSAASPRGRARFCRCITPAWRATWPRSKPSPRGTTSS